MTRSFGPPPAAVHLEDVSVRRQGKEILRQISFTIAPGEHWVILGPNGAGKSTVLSLCGAQAFPTSGTVDVLGHRIGRVELQALRRSIGHVNPRHPLQSALTVSEVILTGATGTTETVLRSSPSALELRRASELIALLGLGGKSSERWPNLSQGERGRVLIARALIAEPRLLLLDEPSTGLDLAAREQLVDTLDGLARSHPDVASVLVTHHLEEIPESSTHAMLLSHGRITASGPIAETLTAEHVTTAFEHAMAVEIQDGRWRARTHRSLA
jgi:iron complex transport system ATP-binding protein